MSSDESEFDREEFEDGFESLDRNLKFSALLLFGTILIGIELIVD